MAELTIVASQDTLLEQTTPNDNYGSSANVEIGITYIGEDKGSWTRALGNFDLSAIPALSTINSAKMVRNIFQINGSGTDTKLSRCTRPADWRHFEATWNNYKAGTPWTNGGSDFDDVTPGLITYAEPAGTGEHEVTGLKSYVDDAIANRDNIVSILLRMANEDPGVTKRYIWRSSEYGSDEWRLIVDYEPPAAPSGHESRPRPSGRSGARPARPASGRRAARAAQPATPHRTQTRR